MIQGILAPKEILNLILDINIQALVNLETRLSMRKNSYKLLVSEEELLLESSKTKSLYEGIKNTSNSVKIIDTLCLLRHTWYNTLKNTLFTIESDLITLHPYNYQNIMELWVKIFYEVDRERIIQGSEHKEMELFNQDIKKIWERLRIQNG